VLNGPGEPEVSHFRLTVFEKYIFELEVSVDELTFSEETHGFQYLLEIDDSLTEGHMLQLHSFGKRASFTQLEDQKTLISLEVVGEQLDDEGAVQALLHRDLSKRPIFRKTPE
jgi:hypothetical protein